ncbi:hypothetical protein CHLNCDRAFT_145205 [Chlorella variabilis]|uniref:Phosphofructokinase domain-containing protein n=1 Tax=Chlorella variabilis TaxID=554065 RepID=E1ZDX3_CHLVA|nr:hypothetical protein CHLNCDRAFT_145205 [Chlorella variabilis]EFN55932.1 hypothetical protein CHLNCDRAFT_145205 [Chlorella variabilis]|eukprot:XP_005848034.1 hypothetical protein CHLNCDRAFT_145205 [Chlorella variabilis]
MAGEEGGADPPANPQAATAELEPPAKADKTPKKLPRVDSIPVVARADGMEFLEIKDLRKHLSPQAIGDKDLVRINIMNYESSESSGSHRDHGPQMAAALFDPAGSDSIELPDFALRSGPRRTIYHNPKDVTAAIVTCGGLCPGLNDVVQNIVYTLGTSRGNAKMPAIVEGLRLWGINPLYVIGGKGGNAAAHPIAKECAAQGVVCNVVGVPKSIDNDIQLIDRCFGFDTAVEEAQRSLISARVEARSSGGISVVKLMGRQSGFIAMNASMASVGPPSRLLEEARASLVAIRFDMGKLCDFVKAIMDRKDYCVICVAEGAGQDIMDSSGPKGTDASGNPILQARAAAPPPPPPRCCRTPWGDVFPLPDSDIGVFLRDIFRKRFPGVDVKYIDPSYMIRSIPTITTDRIYCKVLGQGAVHGAFAGYTDFTVGLVNTHYVFLPTTTIIQFARVVDPKGRQWNRLKTAINQPDM